MVKAICLTRSFHFLRVIEEEAAVNNVVPEWGAFHRLEPGHIVVKGYDA